MDEKRFQRAFDQVRSDFFPRWDRDGKWRLELGTYSDSTHEYGYCVPQAKTIWVNPDATIPGMSTGPEWMLIHEICHAVTSGSHGESWKRRMRRAATRARELGNVVLAENLERNVAMYEDAPDIRARDVYSMIDDLLMQLPDASYEMVVTLLGMDLAVRPEELERCYKRLPKEYAERREFYLAEPSPLLRRDVSEQ